VGISGCRPLACSSRLRGADPVTLLAPDITSWVGTVQAGSPVGTVVARTPNVRGPAATVTVTAKSGPVRAFAGREVDGMVEVLTAGPIAAGAASLVSVVTKNKAGTSTRQLTVRVTAAAPAPEPPAPEPEPPPPPPPSPVDLPADMVRPVFLPRAARMVLTGRGALGIATAGQVFPMGWWPEGRVGCLRTTAATRAGLPPGALLPTQIDVHLPWPDGSARFVSVTAEAPLLAYGEAIEVVLEPGARVAGPGEPLTWAAAAQGKSVVATIDGARIDLLAAVDGAPWRAGPLRIERRAHVDLGGSRRVIADIAFAADGSTSVDVQFRNDGAMAGGGGSWTGRCTLLVNGIGYDSGEVRHGIYSCLRRRVSDAPAPPVLDPDRSLAIDSGLLPRFDLALQPTRAALDEWQNRRAADPAWRERRPYNGAGINRYMPGTGGRGDIGYIPQWHAAWLVAGGLEWRDIAMDFADEGFSVPLNIWDRATGTPMMGLGLRANIWADGRDGRFQPALEDFDVSGWAPDTSHKPQLHLVPFLMTADRAHLDGLQSEAAWAMMTTHPAYHRADPTYPGLMLKGNQQREGAWKLRDVLAAWWATPAGDPFGDCCGEVLASNLRYLADRRAVWREQHGDYAGWLAESQYGADYYQTWAPWQADFLVDTLAAAWQHGWDDAGRFIAFMCGGFFGHRHLSQGGWDPHDGCAYNVPGMIGATHVNGWEAAAAEMRRRGWSFSQAGWPDGYFGVYSAQSLVRFRELFPTRGHIGQQFRWLLASGAPGLTRDSLAGPLIQHSVMPRGETRA